MTVGYSFVRWGSLRVCLRKVLFFVCKFTMVYGFVLQFGKLFCFCHTISATLNLNVPVWNGVVCSRQFTPSRGQACGTTLRQEWRLSYTGSLVVIRGRAKWWTLSSWLAVLRAFPLSCLSEIMLAGAVLFGWWANWAAGERRAAAARWVARTPTASDWSMAAGTDRSWWVELAREGSGELWVSFRRSHLRQSVIES